jgi:hypothetical protein
MSTKGAGLSYWQWALRSAVHVPEPPVAEASNYKFKYVALIASHDIRLFCLLPTASYDEELLGDLLHVFIGLPSNL